MNIRTFKLVIDCGYNGRIEYTGLSRVAVERYIDYHKEQGIYCYWTMEE